MTAPIFDRAALDGPLHLVNATIHTLDPVIGDLRNAGLLLNGDTIVAVEPGPPAAAGDDGPTVIDCSGLSIVPIAGLSSLAPGSRATFAVIKSDNRKAWEYVIWRPGNAVLVMIDGRPHATTPTARRRASDSPYLGMWIDESGFLHQELTADGRYDETRGGRPHAYQGTFWIDGDRIVYLDDSGFWAYGEFRKSEPSSSELHHAGYLLHPAPKEQP
ncbi:Atu4866 domain-containing protein [Actinoplanes derwentensis]|uniref:Protein Atu4866 n=1 Tax=Actinoplanes derwentensis TaxID=113562 RepID=A0A1H1U5Y3_9ACTN|nr:Atu4866 domain-containing protein [Actinoplanes derwentensis]GID85208.1 hypothetical protein Ade03nite_41320 [Actinoplanes derwentensis]SDS67902.1 protein Atu4866 [Actinoplanes derwentensis]